MTDGSKTHLAALALLAGGVSLLAGFACAQSNEGSAATRALNGGVPPAASATRPRVSPSPLSSSQAGRPTSGAAGMTLASGATEPEPIPMTLGYYVRGDKDCDQVWPGDGDIAWMSPTAFIIDFGGCEPGQFMQTGPNSWREEQRCKSESGFDVGAYTVAYEVIGTDVIKREASLDLDDGVERDDWKHCPAEAVPENARFKS